MVEQNREEKFETISTIFMNYHDILIEKESAFKNNDNLRTLTSHFDCQISERKRKSLDLYNKISKHLHSESVLFSNDDVVMIDHILFVVNKKMTDSVMSAFPILDGYTLDKWHEEVDKSIVKNNKALEFLTNNFK